jgi:hypothetical protein
MKSVIPPELGLVKTSTSHTPCISGISITQIQRISRREIPLALLAFSFSGSSTSCKVPSTLSRISDLCTPCTRYLHKVQILADDCAHLALVSLHSLQRESFMLSLLSFRTETDPSMHSLHSVCTPCTTSTEEKQLKLILTFTVPSTHNEIHSFIHERTITENCKTMSTPCIGSIFLCYIHK